MICVQPDRGEKKAMGIQSVAEFSPCPISAARDLATAAAICMRYRTGQPDSSRRQKPRWNQHSGISPPMHPGDASAKYLASQAESTQQVVSVSGARPLVSGALPMERVGRRPSARVAPCPCPCPYPDSDRGATIDVTAEQRFSTSHVCNNEADMRS